MLIINVLYDAGDPENNPGRSRFEDIRTWMVSNDNRRDLVVIDKEGRKTVFNQHRWISVTELEINPEGQG